MKKNNSKEHVLINAPVGRDAQVMAELLSRHGFEAQIAVRWQNAPSMSSRVQVRSCLRKKL